MKNVSDKSRRRKRNTHFMPSNYFLYRIFYEIMWKITVEPGTPQITIRHVHIACSLPRATNTHSKYCLLLIHCNNGYVNAPQCYDIRTLQSFGQQDNKDNIKNIKYGMGMMSWIHLPLNHTIMKNKRFYKNHDKFCEEETSFHTKLASVEHQNIQSDHQHYLYQ